MHKKILFSFILFLIFSPLFSDEINGNALVVDGDTLKIKNQKIRLLGIDAPEIKQKCKKPYLTIGFLVFSKSYNCGVMSKQQLMKLISKKQIKCIFDLKDRYGRAIADCYIGKKNINSWMVKNGHAIAYRKYSKKYISQEAHAKKNALGIWSGTFVKPEIWRKSK